MRQRRDRDLRETGNELELVLDLAALVGALLLGSVDSISVMD
jgi:hypothetical protein